jgi:hypothetical protein
MRWTLPSGLAASGSSAREARTGCPRWGQTPNQNPGYGRKSNTMKTLACLPRRRTASAPWTPNSIPGLNLWLDLQDPDTLFTDDAGTIPAVAGDKLALWKDKSGGSKHAAQTNNNERSVITANALNGSYPGLYFDANFTTNGRWLETPTLTYGNPQAELWVVCRSMAGGGQVIVETSHDLPNNVGAIMLYGVGVTSYAYLKGDIGYSSSSGPIVVGTTYLRSAVFDTSLASNEVVTYVNGVAGTVVDNANNTTVINNFSMTIGRRFGSNGVSFNGYIGEVFSFNTIISNEDRVLLKALIASKWGLTIT